MGVNKLKLSGNLANRHRPGLDMYRAITDQ